MNFHLIETDLEKVCIGFVFVSSFSQILKSQTSKLEVLTDFPANLAYPQSVEPND